MHIPKGEHTVWCRTYNCEGCVEDSFDAGYLAALDAAEAAVAACGNGKGYIYSDTMTGVEWALDAINKLREEK